ncbi:MAG TPA: Rieske (2Fe-2S) protein [Thermoanaerobaculia bacterium]|nr:Rieske (2Fe-2S) protein [Thermoanaerobaculia bacterium]
MNEPAPAPKESVPTRRSFFGVLVGSISTVVGALMAVPLLRFALHPLFDSTSGTDWFPLGSPEEFGGADPVRAEVSFRKTDGWRVSQVKQTVWVTHDSSGQLRVLSGTCPHLGCVAVWRDDQKSFVCPCHKGTFAKDGERLAGPPPRGLDPLPVKVEGGKLWVKYQYFRQLVAQREVVG